MEKLNNSKYDVLSKHELNETRGGTLNRQLILEQVITVDDGRPWGYSYNIVQWQQAPSFLGIRVGKWQNVGEPMSTNCSDNCSGR